jgi:hypothetical protein
MKPWEASAARPTALTRPRETQWHASGRGGRDGLPPAMAQDVVTIGEGDDSHGEGALTMGIGEAADRA